MTSISTPVSNENAAGALSAPYSVKTTLKHGGCNAAYAGSSGAVISAHNDTVRRPWSPSRNTPASTTSFGMNQSVSVKERVEPETMAICRSPAATGTLVPELVSKTRVASARVAVALGLTSAVALMASNKRSDTVPMGLDAVTIPKDPGEVGIPSSKALAGSSTRITPVTPFPSANPGASDSSKVTASAPPPRSGLSAR